MYTRFFEQVPNYLTLGNPNQDFLNRSQRPFTVRQ